MILPRLIALACIAALSWPASGTADEQVVAGLSQNRISITANFDGTEILIFGAVKRDAPAPDGPPLEVVITVEGPDEAVAVRRKARWAAIWLNRDSVEIDSAPSFYAVSTSGPLRAALSNTEDLRHAITIKRAIRSVGAPPGIDDPKSFTEALIRIREAVGLYQLNEGTVRITEETLFETRVALPANLVEGNYEVRVFLTRGGRIANSFKTAIFVQKVGLERFLFTLAHEQPLLYGLLSIAIAILAGWAASAAFRQFKS
ncbi:TIGR02186 family protein [Profundibacterium mesophilum]|uniref:Transmembrane protein domain containing protein n=1 Tax=Profundibacterium mesophilum KAUST100406-0324 TaxID=1037889 RepID=A0A921NQ75_9RHOB|nr:TIGR02186 family protein [Profundibacterium mesophilum]KAF0675320.1 putative transmembrane protein domain containing protein [Profundibacterium mesophilum KAUST100406-0324]